ncbi:MAG TPA: MBL fold metallo-hydrolase, partial [Thermomicrobiales bacterium]|nr:MBL fold metallo-hydrolase [Thermomicrobiales bacterium]
MIVTVLGGSAAGPNTGAGSAGFLIQHGGTSVVLDLGPDTLRELRQHSDLRELTAVVISHYHLDHMLDLGALRYHVAYNPVSPNHKIALWVPPGTTPLFARWAETFGHEPGIGFFSEHFVFAEYDPATGLAFDGLDIAMAPTVHEAQGWAMRVTADNGQCLGYTADTGPAADLTSHFQGVDLLISEATIGTAVGDADPKRGHLTA